MRVSKKFFDQLTKGARKRAPSLEARQRGWESKRRGERFEIDFKSAAERQGFSVVRIPDGCKQVGARKLIRVKTPFDFVLSRGAELLFVDTKTIGSGNFPLSALPDHQIEDLRKLSSGVSRAGFVIWFIKPDRVEFFDVQKIPPSGSLKPGDGEYLGRSAHMAFHISP